jgi:hypothetical protein
VIATFGAETGPHFNAMHFSFSTFPCHVASALVVPWSQYLCVSGGLQSHFLCYLMLDWGLFEVLYMLNIVMMFESHIQLYNIHEIMA